MKTYFTLFYLFQFGDKNPACSYTLWRHIFLLLFRPTVDRFSVLVRDQAGPEGKTSKILSRKVRESLMQQLGDVTETNKVVVTDKEVSAPPLQPSDGVTHSYQWVYMTQWGDYLLI